MPTETEGWGSYLVKTVVRVALNVFVVQGSEAIVDCAEALNDLIKGDIGGVIVNTGFAIFNFNTAGLFKGSTMETMKGGLKKNFADISRNGWERFGKELLKRCDQELRKVLVKDRLKKETAKKFFCGVGENVMYKAWKEDDDVKKCFLLPNGPALNNLNYKFTKGLIQDTASEHLKERINEYLKCNKWVSTGWNASPPQDFFLRHPGGFGPRAFHFSADQTKQELLGLYFKDVRAQNVPTYRFF